VTGSEGEIQNFISEWIANNLGAKVDVWEPDLEALKSHPAFVAPAMPYKNRPNVVGVCKGEGGGGRSLIYNGHVDVIPAGPEESWRQKPWAGAIDGRRIFGRGSSDMKGGLAAYTMAMRAIIDSGAKLKGDVTLEYVVDEELTGNGTLAAMLRGYVADAGISGETSSMRVQPASIGRIWFEIDVRGKPAGIQRRWEGVNAIEKGYKISQAVNDFEAIRLEEVSHPLYPDIRETIPCMIGMFQAGSYPSAFPDACLLKGSIATVPGEDSDAVKSRFVKHIEAVASTDPWLSRNQPVVRFTGYFAEPSELPVDHPIVQSVIGGFKEVVGRDPIITGRVGAADIRFYNKYGKTPMVIFGPGLTEQMHANNEYVGSDDLITATKVMALATLDWCGLE
jgi:acetylornithine deacetylase